MAYIKKHNARNELVRDAPLPFCVSDGYVQSDQPVFRLGFNIDNYRVSLTEMEVEHVINRWKEMLKAINIARK